MSLSYKTQNVVTLIGSKSSANVLTGVALTSSYQTETSAHPTKTFSCGLMSRVEFLISYTEGSGESSNSIQMKVETTSDKTNFFQLANDSTSGGTSTLTAREFSFTGADASTANINVGLDIAYPYIKVSFKETGVATNAGNVYVEAIISGR